MTRWDRLREMPPAGEARFHVESTEDPIDQSDLICDGCKEPPSTGLTASGGCVREEPTS